MYGLYIGSFNWYSCFRAYTRICGSQWNSIFPAWCNDYCWDCWFSSRI